MPGLECGQYFGMLKKVSVVGASKSGGETPPHAPPFKFLCKSAGPVTKEQYHKVVDEAASLTSKLIDASEGHPVLSIVIALLATLNSFEEEYPEEHAVAKGIFLHIAKTESN